MSRNLLKSAREHPGARHGLIALLAVCGYVLVTGGGHTPGSVSDGCAVVGLIYLVIGLFRLVDRMRFFELTRYGFRRFVELFTRPKGPSETGTYLQFLSRSRPEKPLSGLLGTAIVLLTVALLIALVC